jgi:hypothetical protein
VRPPDADALRDRIDSAEDERAIQRYLEEHPLLMVQHLGGGHGRWVLPQKDLGSEFVTDFVIGEKHSAGYEWCAVELESPRVPMFNQNGDPSRYLNHAIRQIQDWRSWLLRNSDYASRDRSSQGLGLKEITGNVPGLILIARRELVPESTSERRMQMMHDLGIRIHTYDFLVEAVEGRARILADPETWEEYDPCKRVSPPLDFSALPEDGR